MIYDKKIAIIILDDLLSWQKLNVTGFLASSVAVENPEIHGSKFTNASGDTHNAFIKNPLLIYKSNQAQLNKAYKRAKERDLQVGIYTRPLFATKGEEENLELVSKFGNDDQELVGVVIFGENKLVDKAIKGLKFHD